MSYQVIARKWRPQTFEEVTGQEPITRTIKNAIEHERLHHAYLFSGARGVGKTTTARLLAKALNCHKSPKPTPTPCRMDDPEACPSCKEITESRSIDVQELDAASHTGVENVRETIIGSVGFAPARDRFKVFIIDEVHMLSASSFNALLKTIEEPPDRVVFIMATTEKHKVPDTILSRSQQFEFRTIATLRIVERLKLIATAEKIAIEDDALREIARSGEGSMRDAQSAFDQVISFAGTKIKKEDVELALGVAGADLLTRVVNGIAENKPAEALAVVDEVVMRGHDLRNFCRDLLAHLRDLLVTKVSANAELLESAVCDLKELKRQAALFTESDLVRFFHSLADTESKLSKAAQPRYQVEIGIVKLMEMRRLQPLAQLVQRLSALEEEMRAGKPLTQKTAPPSAGGGKQGSSGNRSSVETASGSIASGSVAATGVKRAPAQLSTTEPIMAGESASPNSEATPATSKAETGIAASDVERVKSALESKRKMFLVTVLDAAHSAMMLEDELHIEFTHETRHFRDTLIRSENVKILREVCQEITGREIGVRIGIHDRSGDSGPASKADEDRSVQRQLRESVEKDPLVQQMLRTFRGEIVHLRRVEKEH